MSLEVSGTEVHALNALLTADRVKDVHVEADLGLGDADEIEAAADAQHGKPLLRHRFQTDEVKDVVRTPREETTDGFDRLGSVELMISVAPNRWAACSRFG
jgi:hypothetical protein